MKHVLHGVDVACDADEETKNYDACMICNGGLALCTVCGGAEAAMPTDCPGERMTTKEMDEIYAGRLDFKFGGWVTIIR